MKTTTDQIYEKLLFAVWCSYNTAASAVDNDAIDEVWTPLFEDIRDICEEALEWEEAYERGWVPRCKDLAEPEEDVFI